MRFRQAGRPVAGASLRTIVAKRCFELSDASPFCLVLL